jgi:hypothetical protein
MAKGFFGFREGDTIIMDSRELIDLTIYVIIGSGLLVAAYRLYKDLTRPLPDDTDNPFSEMEDNNHAGH